MALPHAEHAEEPEQHDQREGGEHDPAGDAPAGPVAEVRIAFGQRDFGHCRAGLVGNADRAQRVEAGFDRIVGTAERVAGKAGQARHRPDDGIGLDVEVRRRGAIGWMNRHRLSFPVENGQPPHGVLWMSRCCRRGGSRVNLTATLWPRTSSES